MPRSLVLALLIASIPAIAAASEVRIVTNPEGAEVWLGGVLLGTTTKNGLTLADVQPGPVTYSIRKNGYVDTQRTVQVGSGSEPLVVVVVLSPATKPDAKTDQRPATPDVPQPLPQPKEPAPPRDQPSQPQTAKPVATPQVSPAPQKGKSHTGAILLGVGGAAAAATAVVLLTKKDPLEVDDDGDGFSEKQGDCNDADRDVHPGGEFSVTVSPDLLGTVSCNAAFLPIQVSATNLSCTAVTISNITLTVQPIAGGCFTRNPTQNIAITSGNVAPGARQQVVATRQFGGTAGCCTEGFCGGGFVCSFAETYTVTTSAGQRASNFNFAISFPSGRSCAACQSASDAPVQFSILPNEIPPNH